MIVAGSASPLLLSSAGGYNLTNSLRFRSSASAYLNRTPASAGNRRTFTYSVWLKRGVLDASYNKYFFSARPSSSVRDGMYFGTNQTLSVFANDGSSALLTTTQVFRDVSAWYHIVVAVDTTQATSSNRVKIYVNGSQVTAFGTATYPTQNYDWAFNNSVIHTISDDAANAPTGLYHFDGYMAEINMIDGQALTPSSFGETSTSTGVWIPKKYTGTYGTNGFYLPFTDNSALTTSSNVGLGKDFSGNANYWTTNNISITTGSTYDSMTDVPTLTSATAANYCVLNPLSKGANVSATNGNLNAVISGGSAESLQSTLGMSTGKWYCEMTAGGGGSIFGITTVGANLSSWVGSDTKGYGYRGDTGAVMYNSSALVSGMSTFASGDIISLAFDADAGKLWFAKNGTYYNSGNPAAGTNATVSSIASGNWFVSVGRIASTNDAQFNYGQQPFSYTPPTGFNRLNTFNLPTPTIGATASTTANKYMDVTIWTGDGTSTRSQTSLNFQPDFVWAKSRSLAIGHTLYDAVRGAGASKALFSNSTEVEGGTSGSTASSEFGYISSLNSNGFSTSSGSVNGNYVNSTSNTYVAWNWKANGAGSSNTAGSINSTVSANTTAGFSVVTYTGTGSASDTVGHGLGVTPAMVITKRRSSGSGAFNWMVKHSSLASNHNLILESTGASTDVTSGFGSGGIANLSSSTTFGFLNGTSSNPNNANTSGATYVAYCFSQVAGYSAFGSYAGNGSTDGTFVFTGFRPRFVMIKRTDNVGDWYMLDTSRDPYNLVTQKLMADLSAAENGNGESTSTNTLDILSNGFKMRSTNTASNQSGGTYIYMAFCESPFKFSNAR